MTIDRDEMDLEGLLRGARAADEPGEDLVARVLADAARVQVGQVTTMPPAMPPRRLGWVPRLVRGMGGWPTVSGVTLAGVTGLVVGFAAPDLVDTWSGGQIWSLAGGAGTMPEIGALWDGAWEEAGDV